MFGELFVEVTTSHAVFDGQLDLMDDRACVDASVEKVDGGAGFFGALLKHPKQRVGATVVWQRRGMKVDEAFLCDREQVFFEDMWVRSHADDVRLASFEPADDVGVIGVDCFEHVDTEWWDHLSHRVSVKEGLFVHDFFPPVTSVVACFGGGVFFVEGVGFDEADNIDVVFVESPEGGSGDRATHSEECDFSAHIVETSWDDREWRGRVW